MKSERRKKEDKIKKFIEKIIDTEHKDLNVSLIGFGKIIKISIKNEDKIKVEKNALVFYKKISKLISPYPEISLTEPSNPLVSKIRTKFIQQMILKVKTDSNQTSLPIELIKLLATLPTDWAIDVDPVSIA